MATKKQAAAASKKPAKKASGKSMTIFEERMAELAKNAVGVESSVGGGGTFISTKSGVLSYNGAEMPDNEMDVVILDHIIEYVYYGDSYDADNPQSPLAFAFGRDEDDMVWHENSIEEYRGELCKDSDINQWGSADKGKGKACKNIRRLAVIPADQIDDIENAEIAYIKIPVTSVKGWAGYVRSLASNLNRPPLGVITRISLVRDEKTQFKMKFELVDQIEDAAQFEALCELSEKAAAEIEFPYAPYEEPEEKPRRGAGKKAGRNVPQQRAQTRQPAQRQTAPARGNQRPPAEPAKASGKGGKAPAKAPAKAAPAAAKKRKF
jgi:hypothetical protein